MKTPEKTPEAVLESFKKWLNKGKKKEILEPARHEDFPVSNFQTGVTPAYYTATLYQVFYNELRRKDKGFEDISDSCFAHFSNEYPEAMVKIVFSGAREVNKEATRVLLDLLVQKEMVARWEQPELIDYDLFRNTILKLFKAELVRRGKFGNLTEANDYYKKHSS